MTTNRYKFIGEDNQHVHTLDGKPLFGTSTVLNGLSKPLTWWAAGLAVGYLGWTPIRIPGTRKFAPKLERLEAVKEKFAKIQAMTPEEFLMCLDEAYYAHSKTLKEKAETGTDMHYELEQYVKACINMNDGKPLSGFAHAHHAVQIFANWAEENINEFIVSEAYCYSERLWTGGIVDVVYFDKNNDVVIFDFKSAKDAYLSHFLQDAGYHIAIEENGIFDVNGNLQERFGESIDHAYYGVFPFGMPEPQPLFRPKKDTAKLREGFEACVALHKLHND